MIKKALFKSFPFIITFVLLLYKTPFIYGDEELVLCDFKEGIKSWISSGFLVEIEEVSSSKPDRKAMEVSFYGDPDIPRQGTSVRTNLSSDNCPRFWLAKGYKKISIWIKGDGTDNRITMNFCKSSPLVVTGYCAFSLQNTDLHKVSFNFDKMIGPFGKANRYLELAISKPVCECSFIIERIVVEK